MAPVHRLYTETRPKAAGLPLSHLLSSVPTYRINSFAHTSQ